MLKRIISVTLSLIMAFSFVACIDIKGEDTNGEDTGYENTDDVADTQMSEKLADGYKSVVCETISENKNYPFSLNGDEKNAINICLPKDWQLTLNQNNEYDIYRNNVNIGYVSSVKEDFEDYECVYSYAPTTNGITVEHSIYGRVNDKGENEYFRYFCFSYKLEDEEIVDMYIKVNYNELDYPAVSRMQYSTSLKNIKTDPNFGVTEISQDKLDNGINIVILGNSFIGTSNIGSILSDMCDDKHTVTANSQGFATVHGTYAVSSSTISLIENGEVDALFMCGFYSSEDAEAFKTIVDACKKSNTVLAVFPAHNENSSVIEDVVSDYEYPILINWKGEINDLIESGVLYDDFCVNDEHKHSKPLAGYVGAHMIYRALFGEIPPALDEYSGFTQEYVDLLLGDYVTTGIVTVIDNTDIFPI